MNACIHNKPAISSPIPGPPGEGPHTHTMNSPMHLTPATLVEGHVKRRSSSSVSKFASLSGPVLNGGQLSRSVSFPWQRKPISGSVKEKSTGATVPTPAVGKRVCKEERAKKGKGGQGRRRREGGRKERMERKRKRREGEGGGLETLLH